MRLDVLVCALGGMTLLSAGFTPPEKVRCVVVLKEYWESNRYGHQGLLIGKRLEDSEKYVAFRLWGSDADGMQKEVNERDTLAVFVPYSGKDYVINMSAIDSINGQKYIPSFALPPDMPPLLK
jgi:hypothetical protein